MWCPCTRCAGCMIGVVALGCAICGSVVSGASMWVVSLYPLRWLHEWHCGFGLCHLWLCCQCLHNVPLGELRQALGVIPQEPTLFR
jgi:hypothetical protein